MTTSVREIIDEIELEDRLINTINECHDPVQIGTLTFDPAMVLQEMDPIAWRLALGEEADSLAEDGIYIRGYTISDEEADEWEG